MSKDEIKDITLSVNSIDQLFIAPPLNPFAKDEVELLGQPALMRVFKKMEPDSLRRQKKVRLTLLLPPDQISTDLSERGQNALQRYGQAQIEDNRLRIKRTIWVGLRGFPLGLLFLGVCMGLSATFGSQVITFIPENINSLLAEGLVVIGWIALWNPVSAFIYDWVPFHRENQVYRKMMAMEIRFKPQP